YSDKIALTGFHPLDGARWLRDHGWSMETCRLVAWHTTAACEAEFRGLHEAMAAEFAPPPPPLVAAAFAWADLTSSPSGERWTVGHRLADILQRYPTDSVVHRATITSLSALWDATCDIELRLAQQ